MSKRKIKKPEKKITVDRPVNDLNFARLFLLIGGFFGLAMLLITPPFQVPDEHDHFFRAMMISSGQFVAQSYPFTKAEKGKVPLKYQRGKGGIVPVSVPYTTREVNKKLPFHPEHRQNPDDIKKMLKLPLKMKGYPDVFINTSAAGYSPLLYLPAAAVISVGRLASGSPLIFMYLGRLINLLLFLALVYWALKITPTGKSLFFLLALMPMTLFLAPSVSIDGLTIASALLLTASLLKLAANPKDPVTLQEWLIIPGTAISLALGKIVYTPLLLLFLLNPQVFFGKERSRLYLCISTTVCVILASIAWAQLKTLELNIDYSQIPFDFTSFQYSDKLLPLIDAKRQLHNLLQNPLLFPQVLATTIRQYGSYFFRTFIGQLGWLDTTLPSWLIWSYPLCLLMSTISAQPTTSRPGFSRALLGVVWLTIFMGIFLGFYLIGSPVNNTFISGVQGRYFIPTTLPLLLIFSAGYIPQKKSQLFASSWPWIYSIIVLSTTTYTLWYRYY